MGLYDENLLNEIDSASSDKKTDAQELQKIVENFNKKLPTVQLSVQQITEQIREVVPEYEFNPGSEEQENRIKQSANARKALSEMVVNRRTKDYVSNGANVFNRSNELREVAENLGTYIHCWMSDQEAELNALAAAPDGPDFIARRNALYHKVMDHLRTNLNSYDSIISNTVADTLCEVNEQTGATLYEALHAACKLADMQQDQNKFGYPEEERKQLITDLEPLWADSYIKLQTKVSMAASPMGAYVDTDMLYNMNLSQTQVTDLAEKTKDVFGDISNDPGSTAQKTHYNIFSLTNLGLSAGERNSKIGAMIKSHCTRQCKRDIDMSFTLMQDLNGETVTGDLYHHILKNNCPVYIMPQNDPDVTPVLAYFVDGKPYIDQEAKNKYLSSDPLPEKKKLEVPDIGNEPDGSNRWPKWDSFCKKYLGGWFRRKADVKYERDLEAYNDRKRETNYDEIIKQNEDIDKENAAIRSKNKNLAKHKRLGNSLTSIMTLTNVRADMYQKKYDMPYDDCKIYLNTQKQLKNAAAQAKDKLNTRIEKLDKLNQPSIKGLISSLKGTLRTLNVNANNARTAGNTLAGNKKMPDATRAAHAILYHQFNRIIDGILDEYQNNPDKAIAQIKNLPDRNQLDEQFKTLESHPELKKAAANLGEGGIVALLNPEPDQEILNSITASAHAENIGKNLKLNDEQKEAVKKAIDKLNKMRIAANAAQTGHFGDENSSNINQVQKIQAYKNGDYSSLNVTEYLYIHADTYYKETINSLENMLNGSASPLDKATGRTASIFTYETMNQYPEIRDKLNGYSAKNTAVVYECAQNLPALKQRYADITLMDFVNEINKDNFMKITSIMKDAFSENIDNQKERIDLNNRKTKKAADVKQSDIEELARSARSKINSMGDSTFDLQIAYQNNAKARSGSDGRNASPVDTYVSKMLAAYDEAAAITGAICEHKPYETLNSSGHKQVSMEINDRPLASKCLHEVKCGEIFKEFHRNNDKRLENLINAGMDTDDMVKALKGIGEYEKNCTAICFLETLNDKKFMKTDRRDLFIKSAEKVLKNKGIKIPTGQSSEKGKNFSKKGEQIGSHMP